MPPTVTVGNAANPDGLAVDEATDTVYVVNTADDTVSVINGAACNAATASGCGQTPTTVPVGAQNFGYVAIDQTTPSSTSPTGSTTPSRSSTARRRTYDGGLPIIYRVIPSPACATCTGLTTPATSGVPATVIAGLAHGTTYTFKVVARDAAGSGPPSAPSNAITP
jgi:hypothetical protein